MQGGWRTLSRSGAGRSDILRRAIDSIYEPVWQTYRAHRQEKGYGHSSVQTGPAEALKFSVRRLHRPPDQGDKIQRPVPDLGKGASGCLSGRGGFSQGGLII